MFIELYNQSIMSFKIAEELSDEDFRKGWRIRRYLKNSQVDFVKYIAKVQEEADKANNELPVDSVPKVYQYGPRVTRVKPFAKTLFHNCDNWRYND